MKSLFSAFKKRGGSMPPAWLPLSKEAKSTKSDQRYLQSGVGMDPFSTAQIMKSLVRCMDQYCRPEGLSVHQFDGAPCGTAYVTITPGEQGNVASTNYNRVYLCGAEGGLTADGIARIASLFAEAGVQRFYGWLSPGPDLDQVRNWLAAAGMTPNHYVTYPTLVRDASKAPHAATDLDIRKIGPGDLPALEGRLEGVAWPDFLRSIGAPGFHHYLAFAGDEPVGSASLCVFDTIGYLGNALTAEVFRRRGAQRALIARRIEEARALGCQVLISETLSMLTASLGNLRWAGFKTVFEKEVYQSKPPVAA